MASPTFDPATTTHEELLDRLERLVLRWLGRRWTSPRSLWRLQTDLLDLQRDIQAAIAVAKRDRSPDGRERTREFRQVIWHTRRLGDALAWVFFKYERRVLDPLSYNAKVPIPPDGHGSRGLIAAARALSQSLGFPLLHDITDVLRVGDITFFTPEGRPQTVEVKTTLTGSERVGAETRLEYQVTAIWPSKGPPPTDVPRRPLIGGRPPNARLGRQLARMTRATAFQDAPVGKPTTVEGIKTLILEAKGTRPQSDHWQLLRRMIRRARRDGYASAVADRAVLYLAFYNSGGFSSLDEIVGRLPPDLVASGILVKDSSKNSLYVLNMPDPTSPGPHRYLPYVLYPLPRRWIVDILRGRLLVFAIFNPGRVAEALEAIGLRTQDGNGKAYLRVFADVEVSGAKYLAELPLGDNITEMVMEARSLESVVEAAETFAEGIQEQLPGMMQDDG